MMTVREAMQRVAVYQASIRRGAIGWIVTLNEWRGYEAQHKAVYCDDLEDAVLEAGKLRRFA